jgi:hypothetical protein
LPHSGFGIHGIDNQVRFDSQRKLFAAEAKDRNGESTTPYVIMDSSHYDMPQPRLAPTPVVVFASGVPPNGEVEVGNHLPPVSIAVPLFLVRFDQAFRLAYATAKMLFSGIHRR